MSIAAKTDIDTPQTVWDDIESFGGRLLMTIPFNSSVDKMKGFIAIMGEGSGEDSVPTLTLCVSKPTGGAIISTVVCPNSDNYLDFADKLYTDAYTSFKREEELVN
tara:strand:+ start:1408 stop:1725 length:318 start_codon:yes stop_codon:yes gene_type:complete